MIAIDINSSRSTKGGGIEETALNTNLEAADEIARQLRLRDMGGLVVIDFIDMTSNKNQREVEQRMRNALEIDKARVQVGRISRFGLLEMSRQRLRPSLGETSAIVCPRCSGQGSIRDTKSLSLSILRLLEEEANKERSAEVRVIVPTDVATYLLNEKRNDISDIEKRTRIRVLVIPNISMETPHFEVQRLRDDHTLVKTNELSYTVIDEESSPEALIPEKTEVVQPQKAAVGKVKRPAAVAKAPVKTAQPGLIKRILNSLFGEKEQKKPAPKSTGRKPASGNRNRKPDNLRQRSGNKPQPGRSQNNQQRQRNKQQAQKQDRAKTQAKAGEDKTTSTSQENRPQRRPGGNRPERSSNPRKRGPRKAAAPQPQGQEEKSNQAPVSEKENIVQAPQQNLTAPAKAEDSVQASQAAADRPAQAEQPAAEAVEKASPETQKLVEAHDAPVKDTGHDSAIIDDIAATPEVAEQAAEIATQPAVEESQEGENKDQEPATSSTASAAKPDDSWKKTRTGNDPRINAKPVSNPEITTTVITAESLQQPAAVVPTPSRPKPGLASKDPRSLATATPTEEDPAEEPIQDEPVNTGTTAE
jgi:ribonuclease E